MWTFSVKSNFSGDYISRQEWENQNQWIKKFDNGVIEPYNFIE